MTPSVVFMSLNVRPTEAHRIFWNGSYFDCEAALAFNQQAKSKEELKNQMERALLILKLVPFKDQFKSKLFSSITGEAKKEQTNVIGISVVVNLFTKKVVSIHDCGQSSAELDEFGTSKTDPSKSVSMKLSKAEEDEFISVIEKQMQGPLSEQLSHPFVCFFEELLDQNWRERIPKQLKKGALIPFQGLFPFAGSIERVYNEQMFALDDLYCVTASCNCNEVNCIVLTFDHKSGQEVGYGGFKLHFEKQTFKPMPNFPQKINAQEWFKQFSVSQLISLPLLLETRYHFLRKILH